MKTLDLAAERAQSLARREERYGPERIRHRARRLLLTMRWNASPEELREAIQHDYPKFSEQDTEALFEAALEVQRTERQTITPEALSSMVKTLLNPKQRDQLRDLITRELHKDSTATYHQLNDLARAEIGEVMEQISQSNFYNSYLTPIREEMGLKTSADRKRKKRTRSSDKKKPATTEPAPEIQEKAAENEPVPEVETREPPQPVDDAEVADFFALQEDDDFITLEGDEGIWRITSSLTFKSRRAAHAAVAALSTSLAREESW